MTESERVLVAAELLQSIDGPDDERTDEEWLAEVNRRAERVRRGDATGASWPLVRDELRSDLLQPNSASSDAAKPFAPEVK